MTKRAKKWQTISSKSLLKHPRLEVSEDKVRLPNGKTSNYLRHAPTKSHSVVIIAIDSQQRVLIQKEYSYPPDKIMWQLPGGSIEPNESVKKAALRELAEESGYSAKKTKIIGHYYTHNRLSDQKQYVVICQNLFEKSLPADADEFIDNYWFTKTELLQKIAKGGFNNINLLAALNLWLHQAKDKR